MRVLLDSSTLIAAMLPDHPHHEPCRAWLSRAGVGSLEFFVAGHSVAEVFSVLTRLPRTPRISPDEARELIQENMLRRAQVVAITADDYAALVDELAQRSLAGGIVYDAIVARSAALARVDWLVTLNVRDFQRVWVSPAGQVISPLLVRPPG